MLWLQSSTRPPRKHSISFAFGRDNGGQGWLKAHYNRVMRQQNYRDWSGCEIIEYDPAKMGGAPTVRGRRITPDTFVENFNDGFSPEEIAQELLDEPVEDVKAVLSYASKAGYLERSF